MELFLVLELIKEICLSSRQRAGHSLMAAHSDSIFAKETSEDENLHIVKHKIIE